MYNEVASLGHSALLDHELDGKVRCQSTSGKLRTEKLEDIDVSVHVPAFEESDHSLDRVLYLRARASA